MTEQVLVDAHGDATTTATDSSAAFEELRRALALVKPADDGPTVDPEVAKALRGILRRLRGVWDRKGSFLEVGLSPFVLDLLDRVDPEGATV
ncbi:MAG: hypothetical protein ACYS47_10570 [Planctomycetota bacterium]|jgi:hypothetical protein